MKLQHSNETMRPKQSVRVPITRQAKEDSDSFGKYTTAAIPAKAGSTVSSKRNTIAKLRDTVDRHARWCPFVKLNKKLHSVHRRVRALEHMYLDSESDDDSEPEVPEVDSAAHNDHGDVEAVELDDDDNGEEMVEESGNNDDDAGKQAPKPQKATQTTTKITAIRMTGHKSPRKTVPAKTPLHKQAVTKTPAAAKRPAAKPSTTSPDSMQVEDGSDEEESQSDDEDEQGAAEKVSDGELSSVDDGKVEAGRKAHEKLTTPKTHQAAKATSSLRSKGASGSKRTASEMESDPPHGAKKLDSKKSKA
jgi:hypothetical protein